MIKISYIKSIFFLLFLSIKNLSALYFMDINDLNYLKESTKPHPYCASIEINGELDGRGTGTLIANNAVLTINHVVTTGENRNAFEADKILVYFYHKDSKVEKKVKSVHLYQTEANPNYDNVALLILADPVIDIEPLKIKSFEKEKKINKFTVMGFGNGGLIDSSLYPMVDLPSEEGKVFRWGTVLIEDLPSSELRIDNDPSSLNCISLPQLKIKVGKGDSGSALLDDDRNIIGVAQKGKNKLYEVLNPVAEIKKSIQINSELLDSYRQLEPRGKELISQANEIVREKDEGYREQVRLYDQDHGWWKWLCRLVGYLPESKIKMPQDLLNYNFDDFYTLTDCEKITNKASTIANLVAHRDMIKNVLDEINALQNPRFIDHYAPITPEIKIWVDEIISENQ